MNRQDIYNRVRDHLLTQNKKAGNSYGTGQYRTPDGLRCGIGGIIPDELYNPDWDYNYTPINTIVEDEPEVAAYFGAETYSDAIFLKGLQRIHDSYEVSEWHLYLTDFAGQYGLRP